MSDINVTLPESRWQTLLTVLTWAESEHDDDVDVGTEISLLKNEVREQVEQD